MANIFGKFRWYKFILLDNIQLPISKRWINLYIARDMQARTQDFSQGAPFHFSYTVPLMSQCLIFSFLEHKEYKHMHARIQEKRCLSVSTSHLYNTRNRKIRNKTIKTNVVGRRNVVGMLNFKLLSISLNYQRSTS